MKYLLFIIIAINSISVIAENETFSSCMKALNSAQVRASDNEANYYRVCIDKYGKDATLEECTEAVNKGLRTNAGMCVGKTKNEVPQEDNNIPEAVQ